MTEIRQRLAERRQELGFSLMHVVKLARELHPAVKGLHQTALKAWERNGSGRAPSDLQLVAWAAALGMTIELKPAPENAAKERAA